MRSILNGGQSITKGIEKRIQKKLRNEVDKLNQKIARKLTGRKKKDKSLEEIVQQKSIQTLMAKKEGKTAKSAELTHKLSDILQILLIFIYNGSE